MHFFKAILISTLLIIICLFTGCQASDGAKTFIDNKVNGAKEELSSQIQSSVQNAVDQKVDNISTSVENTLDPKLKEIRKNMENIKQTAIIYYSINQKMPMKNKIESFFPQTFSNMKIEYKTSMDGQTAFVNYIGKEYTKEKVQDIIVNPKAK